MEGVYAITKREFEDMQRDIYVPGPDDSDDVIRKYEYDAHRLAVADFRDMIIDNNDKHIPIPDVDEPLYVGIFIDHIDHNASMTFEILDTHDVQGLFLVGTWLRWMLHLAEAGGEDRLIDELHLMDHRAPRRDFQSLSNFKFIPRVLGIHDRQSTLLFNQRNVLLDISSVEILMALDSGNDLAEIPSSRGTEYTITIDSSMSRIRIVDIEPSREIVTTYTYVPDDMERISVYRSSIRSSADRETRDRQLIIQNKNLYRLNTFYGDIQFGWITDLQPSDSLIELYMILYTSSSVIRYTRYPNLEILSTPLAVDRYIPPTYTQLKKLRVLKIFSMHPEQERNPHNQEVTKLANIRNLEELMVDAVDRYVYDIKNDYVLTIQIPSLDNIMRIRPERFKNPPVDLYLNTGFIEDTEDILTMMGSELAKDRQDVMLQLTLRYNQLMEY